MSKFLKGYLVTMGVLFVIIAIFVACNTYATEYKTTDVGTEISEDSRYDVLFQMVGVPDWPFGATTVRVIVRECESGNKIDAFEAKIYDDGATLRDSNWKVIWFSNRVEITLMGSEQEDSVYTIELPLIDSNL